MADFPYTTVPGKLRELFGKIQQVGVPQSASRTWLASIGFTSSNDRSVIPVLRFIDFLDAQNKPTERYRKYRDTNQAGKVLAEGIKEGYSELFHTFPDANRQSEESLKNFFKTRSKAGDQSISKTVATFRALCQLADFSEVKGVPSIDIKPDLVAGEPTSLITPKPAVIRESTSGITININIEFSLPTTTDEKVYENLFAALKKHILSGDMSFDS